jgi:hypothetical protein
MENHVLSDLRQRLDELVPTLEEATREVAALLEQGYVSRGLSGLREVLEALQSFHEGLVVLMLADRDALPRNGLVNLKCKLEQVYPSVLAALEANDTVTMADILEYELAETFAEYRDRVG